MARSLGRYGQLSPIVVCSRQKRAEVLDGFKRLAATSSMPSPPRLRARLLDVDEGGAKAAIYGLNQVGRHLKELEEAWIVRALVREDGLSQLAVAELLGRHKSWVCRRLALLERLCPEAQEDLRLGLLSPTPARQLARLPAGNQAELLTVWRREALNGTELCGVGRSLGLRLRRCPAEIELAMPASAAQKKRGWKRPTPTVREMTAEALPDIFRVCGMHGHLSSVEGGRPMSQAIRNEIVRRFGEGASMLAIARLLGISRYQVHQVLQEVQRARAQGGSAAGELPIPGQRRPSTLDPYEQTIKDLLERYPSLSAVRVHEELYAQGFRGGYTIVRQRVRQLRPSPRRQLVLRFETAPGAQAQMDYASYAIDFSAEGSRRINLFSYVLGYSRRQYLRFVPRQDGETTLREHIRAFEHLGGVAATCLYDNMKVVVSSFDDGEPIYNSRFLAFATHYGFRPLACRPRRPQTKGKIERPFAYVESSLLGGRSFRSLEHLNEVTAWWLANVADVRVHRTTGKRPLDLHREEQPQLIALPAHAYDPSPVVYRVVDAEGFVAWRQNRYSVPWRYIGQTLPVRITESELLVYSPAIEEIARHRLLDEQRSGGCSQQPEHLPSRDNRQRQAQLRARFEELGPAATRFLDGLVERRRYGKDEAHKVLALLGTYSREDLNRALERANRYGAFSLRAVERILAVTARPKGISASSADDRNEPVGPAFPNDSADARPTSDDYQSGLDEESTNDQGDQNFPDADDDNRPASSPPP